MIINIKKFLQEASFLKENYISKQFNIYRINELTIFFKGRDLNKVKIETWPIVPKSYRQYKLISEYIPIENEKENKFFLFL